ncbi:hypothetical protein ABH966_002370 [Lysinibacillus sp. RC46]|uniref:hypothetical protein n=1 Tax=unclassified Lysinibacillus TaxID=2636778 RepID=UPI00351795EA
MKVEEALEIVYEYTIGDNSVLHSIRVGLGLNEKNYHSLIEAMKVLITEYSNKPEVPKKLALCFVDISKYFYFHDGKYSTEEEEKFEDAIHEIAYLAEELFG